MIKQFAAQLIGKHKFDLSPGKALWIKGPIEKGTLIIAVAGSGEKYVIARTFFYKGKEITGFRVYYDFDWNPVAAVNDVGNVIRDAEKASIRLCKMIEEIYLDSDESWVRVGEYIQ